MGFLERFRFTSSASTSPKQCPYCFPIVDVVKDSRDGSKFRCPSCNTVFSSDLEPILPPMQGDATPSRRTCIPLEQGRLLDDTGVLLCRTCLNHQTILMQLLAAYDPPPGDDDAVERRVRSHREDLEKRYPLCTTCRSRIQERLKIVEYKVRCKRLAGRSRPQDIATTRHNDRQITPSWILAVLDAVMVQGVFTALFIAEYFNVDLTILKPLISWTEQYFVWHAFVLPLSIFNVATNISRPLICAWTLFLLFMRMSLINLIASDSVYLSAISPPPFLLLSIACYVLLFQIYIPNNPRKSPPTMRNHSTQISPFSLPSDVPMRRILSKEDLTAKLASWDTALDNLGPKTPLNAKFCDFDEARPESSSKRASPFSLPKLSIATPLPARSPLTMKPSLFDSSRSSGLETVFEGFCIDETRRKSESCTVSTQKNPMDQIVLSLGLILARLVVDSQLSLIALLLVLSLGLRGFTWSRIGSQMQFIVSFLALSRLAWLVMQIHTDLAMLPNLTFLHERNPSLEYAIDFVILLSR